jgi:hypothetical protein
MWGQAHCSLEGPQKMKFAQMRRFGEFLQAQRLGQSPFDLVANTPQYGRGDPLATQALGVIALRPILPVDVCHQHRAKRLGEQATFGSALAHRGPDERADVQQSLVLADVQIVSSEPAGVFQTRRRLSIQFDSNAIEWRSPTQARQRPRSVHQHHSGL